MKANKILRFILVIIVVLLIGFASNYLVKIIPISSFKIFDTVNLFTYFGVLIGFALTIFTFGLSMVSDIKSKIDNHNKISDNQKKQLYSKLVSGFGEIKEDIWIIFVSIIIVIGFEIANQIPNPFGWRVEEYNLPQTVNLTLFITTTIAMFDIMQTLFNLSEINLHLNKYDEPDND